MLNIIFLTYSSLMYKMLSIMVETSFTLNYKIKKSITMKRE